MNDVILVVLLNTVMYNYTCKFLSAILWASQITKNKIKVVQLLMRIFSTRWHSHFVQKSNFVPLSEQERPLTFFLELCFVYVLEGDTEMFLALEILCGAIFGKIWILVNGALWNIAKILMKTDFQPCFDL